MDGEEIRTDVRKTGGRLSRKTVFFGLMIALVLLLPGCGGADSGSSGQPEGTAGEMESAAAESESTSENTSEGTKASGEDHAGEGMLLIEVNGETCETDLEDNSAAHALTELIGEEGLRLELDEYGGFEKVGPLPEELPAEDEQMDVSPGDIVLYQGNQISILYGENSWSYTRLGHVKGMTGEQLKELLGDGDVSVTLRQ